jgi:hypothetical protein
MLLCSACLLLAACNSDGGGGCAGGPNGDCIADLAMPDLAVADAAPYELHGPPDFSCVPDLAGSQLQICGGPDASFVPALCRCVGDP